MSRPRTLAIVFVFLAALPAVAHAQTARDVVNALSKGASSSNSTASADMSDWYDYNRAGWRAINKGYYDTAEHEFLSAIKAAKRPTLNDPRLIARSYADYAWALQRQGRNAEAEPLLKWVLIVREARLDPTATPIVQTLNQMATLYSDLGRYADAEPLLRRAIDTQAKLPKPNALEHSRSQTLMGLLLTAQRRFAEAEPYFRKSLTLLERAVGPSHSDTGDAVSNLAWAYHEQGKDDEARPLFERALQIFERTRGESDYSIGHVADGLGQILAKAGKSAEAEAYFLRAIGIWEQFPDEGPSLLSVLRHYADLLEQKGRADDLEKVKTRIAPLRAKFTMAEAKLGLGLWYRFPNPPTGDGTAPQRMSGPVANPRVPG